MPVLQHVFDKVPVKNTEVSILAGFLSAFKLRFVPPSLLLVVSEKRNVQLKGFFVPAVWLLWFVKQTSCNVSQQTTKPVVLIICVSYSVISLVSLTWR
jgi:hypothetical protein